MELSDPEAQRMNTNETQPTGSMRRMVRLRPWEPHEIDIPPEQWFAEVRKANQALLVYDHARKALERRISDLEHSSFYHRSKMRAQYPDSYEATYREEPNEKASESPVKI
jgi:hypothetical protein